MITSKQLKKCLSLIEGVYNNLHSKQMKDDLMDVAVALKLELDIVNAWELSSESKGRRGNIDIDKLMQDNIQLIQENKRLSSLIENCDENLQKEIDTLNSKINATNMLLSQLIES